MPPKKRRARAFVMSERQEVAADRECTATRATAAQAAVTAQLKDGKTSAQETRRVQRYLDDLERSNHTDHHSAFHSEAGDEGGNTGSLALGTLKKRKNKADQSMAVRVLLMYRKNLNLLVDESVSRPLLPPDPLCRACMMIQGLARVSRRTPSYLTAAAPAPSAPVAQLCSVCGYKSKHRCLKCGFRYCSLDCKNTHEDTRCT